MLMLIDNGNTGDNGIYAKKIGPDEDGRSIHVIYIDYEKANIQKTDFIHLMDLDYTHACNRNGNFFYEYWARFQFPLFETKKWMMMILGVDVSEQRNGHLPPSMHVLSTILIQDHGIKGMELDSVCGVSPNRLTRTFTDLLPRHFDNAGQSSRKIGSLIVCLAIAWIIERLNPDTPRIFLKAVTTTVMAYGTNGFGLSVRKNQKQISITRSEVDKFYSGTYTGRTQDTIKEAERWLKSKNMTGKTLLYMYMYMYSRSAKRSVRQTRCKKVLEVPPIVFGISNPA
jgi:hypothetical protein